MLVFFLYMSFKDFPIIYIYLNLKGNLLYVFQMFFFKIYVCNDFSIGFFFFVCMCKQVMNRKRAFGECTPPPRSNDSNYYIACMSAVIKKTENIPGSKW